MTSGILIGQSSSSCSSLVFGAFLLIYKRVSNKRWFGRDKDEGAASDAAIRQLFVRFLGSSGIGVLDEGSAVEDVLGVEDIDGGAGSAAGAGADVDVDEDNIGGLSEAREQELMQRIRNLRDRQANTERLLFVGEYDAADATDVFDIVASHQPQGQIEGQHAAAAPAPGRKN